MNLSPNKSAIEVFSITDKTSNFSSDEMLDLNMSTFSSLEHTFNSSNACFIANRLEPVPDTRLQAFIFTLYLVTSIFSVLGNALVLLVALFSCRKLTPFASGHATFSNTSSSSRSIRRYLSNLAVSDITLALMSMPFMYSNIVLGYWEYPHWLCPLAQFAQLLTSFTTSSTLTIIGIERYFCWFYFLQFLLKFFINFLSQFLWNKITFFNI